MTNLILSIQIFCSQPHVYECFKKSAYDNEAIQMINCEADLTECLDFMDNDLEACLSAFKIMENSNAF